MVIKNIKSYPVTRLGWHHWYVNRFNKEETDQQAHMATWYLLMHLAFDAEET